MVETRPTVELFVRSLQPTTSAQPQESVVSWLERLDEANVIEDYEVTVWGRQISRDSPIADTDTGAAILEQIEAVREWVADAGVSVDGIFERRVVESELAGESYAATDLPRMLLVGRTEGELEFVAPHEREDGTCSITDRLARLKAEGDISADHPDGDVPAIAD